MKVVVTLTVRFGSRRDIERSVSRTPRPCRRAPDGANPVVELPEPV